MASQHDPKRRVKNLHGKSGFGQNAIFRLSHTLGETERERWGKINVLCRRRHRCCSSHRIYGCVNCVFHTFNVFLPRLPFVLRLFLCARFLRYIHSVSLEFSYRVVWAKWKFRFDFFASCVFCLGRCFSSSIRVVSHWIHSDWMDVVGQQPICSSVYETFFAPFSPLAIKWYVLPFLPNGFAGVVCVCLICSGWMELICILSPHSSFQHVVYQACAIHIFYGYFVCASKFQHILHVWIAFGDDDNNAVCRDFRSLFLCACVLITILHMTFSFFFLSFSFFFTWSPVRFWHFWMNIILFILFFSYICARHFFLYLFWLF